MEEDINLEYLILLKISNYQMVAVGSKISKQ